MPLETIYLTRHGHRLNWTIDLRTGIYKSQFPTPTGNPADPALTSHGVRQSHELAVHVNSPQFHPKPFRVYSSPFYRCLQTIQPTVEELKKQHQDTKFKTEVVHGQIDQNADFDVRIENGLGEWFGPTTFFDHPPHPTPGIMRVHFPSLVPSNAETKYVPLLHPSRRGETIAELHHRVGTVLEGIIADLDAEIASIEADLPAEQRTSKSILICSHAAPLIAMGRVLTGRMPSDSSEEDFFVFTAGLSTFRRRDVRSGGKTNGDDNGTSALAEGTQLVRAQHVPNWQGGQGVGGGWDCVGNGDCSFLSGGAERGWHFSGEESFDTGPMASVSEPPAVGDEPSGETGRPGTKL
ncbi:Histidine phosphatase superfamily clade-1 [Penicillium hispanicum]|uniref:Histidine phosphatase superfamily clade-1 n=1 Tax=Penicillium hispanicum TaxID=1080232 RepID=UPI00253FB2A2|nr:Histidine phosphatase superfamily clade-1 [Penicillium hispanicum]KAJ5578602.1 Histidine phosphatase superfamily clade-1 [Penicillium hispanicum]